jgi:hypothetical protein
MKIRRFVCVGTDDGTVSVSRHTAVEDTTADASTGATTLWGWDSLPTLPAAADYLEAGHDRPTLFPVRGGSNVAVIIFPPDGEPRGTESSDLSNANIDRVAGDPLMHRTDTVDLIFVLEGEITLEQPGEDADIDLRHGDFVVQNGGMHKWSNRSNRRAVLAFVLTTTTRDA